MKNQAPEPDCHRPNLASAFSRGVPWGTSLSLAVALALSVN